MHRTVIGARLAAVAVALALAFGLLAPQPALAASRQLAAKSTVNIRAGASTSSDIVGRLERGQLVTAVSTARGWTTITFAGATAYVSSKYLTKDTTLEPPTKVTAGSVRITTGGLNLRKGAGTSYDVLAVLPEGTRVTATGAVKDGFAAVINGSLSGWSSLKYLATDTVSLPAVIGTRTALAALDIRTSSGSDSKTVDEVDKGTALSVTGVIAKGRAQIVFDGAARWVTEQYLSDPENNLPAPPRLPAVTGNRYATTALDIRSTYKDKYTKIAEVPKGTKLAITGVVKNKRMQIVFENAARWVTAKYLSTTPPTGGGPADPYAVEKGLKPNAIKVHRAIMKEFPEIVTFYGVRADPLPDHPSGRALDCMIPNYKSKAGKALGYKLSRWARANAAELGINYVIWDQHIWNNERASEGWRYMASRGSDTANHKNHVHITVYAAGYRPI